MIATGKALYDTSCSMCHGVNTVSGIIADLRYMTPETHARFPDIVLGGMRAGQGMASFADKYNEKELEAIHAYIISRANEGWNGGAGGE